MKRIFLFLLLITAMSSNGQSNFPKPNKTLQDTVFAKGDIVKLPPLLYDLSYPVDPKTKESFKPIADFIKKYPHINFEIAVHTDFRGSKESNQQLSEYRAIHLYEFLVMEFGIDSEKLSSRGYGETCPLISEEDIAKAATNEEKAKLYQFNQRTELRVVYVK